MIMIARTDNAETSDLVRWPPSAGSSRLVSLWVMLRVHAEDFVVLTTAIRDMISCVDRAKKNSQIAPLDVVRQGVWRQICSYFDRLEPICKKLELDSAEKQITHMRNLYDTIDSAGNSEAFPDFFRDLERDLADLSRHIANQFQDRLFMFISPKQAGFLDVNPLLFGEAVQSHFSGATADIEDASYCLGVEKWTAGVFYLMRAMERVLKTLADKLEIKIEKIEYKTWKEILDQIEPAAQKFKPKQTKEQECIARAAVHLRLVSIAWRNPTMHCRERFDQKQAEEIFASVKTFMTNLADGLGRID
jgi:hypothetical protein